MKEQKEFRRVAEIIDGANFLAMLVAVASNG